MDSESTLKKIQRPVSDTGSLFEVGRLLYGKYEILSFLGKGGMGSVYRVRHVLLGVELALKTLDTQHVEDSASSRRFKTEARAAFSLKHPSLVKVHDFGVLENGHPFLVMDLVKGRTLQSLMKERGHLSLSEVESIFGHLCFGLAHAHHHSVVHRDIKPANIMLVDGLSLKEEGSVKILDFGIAKLVNQDRGEMESLTMTGEIFGSPLYMSPEQCSGASIDQRSDVYSLGCVLFEALTGTTPLVGNNPLRTMMLHVNESAPTLREAALGSEFPEALESIVAKMLAKDPSDRYADLGVVAHELSRVCARSRTESSHESARPESNKKIAAADERKQVPTISFTGIQLAAVILATAGVTILFTLCLSKYFKSDAPNTANAVPSKAPHYAGMIQDMVSDIAERSASMKEVFEHAPIIVGTPIGNGMQRIAFPSVSIGTLQFGEHKTCPAQGTIELPIDSSLDLEVKFGTGEVLKNAFVFDKIDPQLLTGLTFVGIGRKNFLVEAQEAEFREQLEAGAKQLLTTAARWKRLERLKLQDVNLTPALLEALDKMHPRTLHFTRVRFAPHSLENRDIFMQIKNLVIENADTGAILEAAAKSTSIRSINIVGSVSAQSIQNLDNCKSLKTIVFSFHHLSPAVVTTASKLKHVSNLIFRVNELSKTQIKELSKDWVPAPSRTRNTVRFERRS